MCKNIKHPACYILQGTFQAFMPNTPCPQQIRMCTGHHPVSQKAKFHGTNRSSLTTIFRIENMEADKVDLTPCKTTLPASIPELPRWNTVHCPGPGDITSKHIPFRIFLPHINAALFAMWRWTRLISAYRGEEVGFLSIINVTSFLMSNLEETKTCGLLLTFL